MTHGTEDHLRAAAHVSRGCFGLWYSGVGVAKKTRPFPSRNSACVIRPSRSFIRWSLRSWNPKARTNQSIAVAGSSYATLGTIVGISSRSSCAIRSLNPRRWTRILNSYREATERTLDRSDPPVRQILCSTSAIRRMDSTIVSREAAYDRRRWPSPASPNALPGVTATFARSEEHTSELQSRSDL